jgi:phosphopantetheinyl transferase
VRNSCEILHAESNNKPISVYYASAGFSEDRNVTKNMLAGELLQRGGFMLLEETNALLIKNNKYGCPQLESQQSLVISFSSAGQRVWAAVAQADALGIDVEASENFCAPYPYDRVFQTDEFHHVSSFCVNKEDGAALLWSCKEAAMKNRGTGFHFMDPRDVRILSCVQERIRRYTAIVATPEKIPVIVIREGNLWLAFAVSG